MEKVMSDDTKTKECIEYLSNWSGILQEKLQEECPDRRLVEEQISFLNQAVNQLKNKK